MIPMIPTMWRTARQTHLPKSQKGVCPEAEARDATGLRPLALFGSWYCLWASTRLESKSCQTWVNSWWPTDAIGGKQGREIYDALFLLIDAATQGYYLESLDFSLAFDYTHPGIVVPSLLDLGLPVNICSMFAQQCHQPRYLTFENFALIEPTSRGGPLVAVGKDHHPYTGDLGNLPNSPKCRAKNFCG